MYINQYFENQKIMIRKVQPDRIIVISNGNLLTHIQLKTACTEI